MCACAGYSETDVVVPVVRIVVVAIRDSTVVVVVVPAAATYYTVRAFGFAYPKIYFQTLFF